MGTSAEPSGAIDLAIRSAVLDAAIVVVEREGTPAVTTREIAAAAGVDDATVVDAFASTDELLVEAALDACSRDLSTFEIEASDTPPLSAFAHHYAKRRLFYRALRIGAMAQKIDARMGPFIVSRVESRIRFFFGTRLGEAQITREARRITTEATHITNSWIVDETWDGNPDDLYRALDALLMENVTSIRPSSLS